MSYDENRISDQIDGGLHEQKQQWDDAIEIVKKLSDWSLKYPRGKIYGMSQMKMDEELVEIEKEAKQFIEQLKNQTP